MRVVAGHVLKELKVIQRSKAASKVLVGGFVDAGQLEVELVQVGAVVEKHKENVFLDPDALQTQSSHSQR